MPRIGIKVLGCLRTFNTNTAVFLNVGGTAQLGELKRIYGAVAAMNSNKTRCILLATRNFNKRIETFQITIDDTVRLMEDKVKNLGVIFDSLLSFEHHIKSLCSRLNGTLSYLNRVKNTLDQ